VACARKRKRFVSTWSWESLWPWVGSHFSSAVPGSQFVLRHRDRFRVRHLGHEPGVRDPALDVYVCFPVLLSSHSHLCLSRSLRRPGWHLLVRRSAILFLQAELFHDDNVRNPPPGDHEELSSTRVPGAKPMTTRMTASVDILRRLRDGDIDNTTTRTPCDLVSFL
jgi:hypothetical protein